MFDNPESAAEEMWRWLAEQQPAVAAALVMRLRALPDEWPRQLFGVSRPDAALDLPPNLELPTPEVAPPGWAEDCPACVEQSNLGTGDFCRYHHGWSDGYQVGLTRAGLPEVP